LLHLVGSSVLLYLIDDAWSNKNQEDYSFSDRQKTKQENQCCETRIFMANIRSALTVSQYFKDNKPVNLTNTHDFYNETDCVMNFNEYKIRLLHHNAPKFQ